MCPAHCGQIFNLSSPQISVISAPVQRQFFWIYRHKPVSTSVMSVANTDTGNPTLDCKLDDAIAAAIHMFVMEMTSYMNKFLLSNVGTQIFY